MYRPTGWLGSLVTTYDLRGFWWTLIGMSFYGVGIALFAIQASLFHGDWSSAFLLLELVALHARQPIQRPADRRVGSKMIHATSN